MVIDDRNGWSRLAGITGHSAPEYAFQQILEKDDKYVGSVEEICRKIHSVSAVPGLDVQFLYEMVLLNFLLGNGDAHFKNYSMITYDDVDRHLAPGYDIVCSKLVIPKGKDSALSINGKKIICREKILMFWLIILKFLKKYDMRSLVISLL